MKKFLAKKQEDKKEKTVSKVRNWYQDRYEKVLIQRNFLFICVVGFMILFGFTITGIIALNSQKVYEPFIVQIEENTGIITKVNNSKIRDLPAEKAVRNATLVRYVLARETYNYSDFQFNYYQIARLMSDSSVYRAFAASVSKDTPGSPVNYGFEKKVDAKIKSLIDLDEKNNLVQIRIAKAVIPAASSNQEAFDKNEKSYIITLRYEYKNLDLSETERYINPLGMQVIAYSINEEVNAQNI